MLVIPCLVSFYVKNSIYAQIHACFMIILIPSQMCCFDFQNLSIYNHYMYYYWPIRQILR
jgi:hypothetical protein